MAPDINATPPPPYILVLPLNDELQAPTNPQFAWNALAGVTATGSKHYVLIGGAVFPLFGAFYYWIPKWTGRMLSERLGHWNFWLM